MQNDLYYAYKRSLSNRFCTCSVYGPMPLSKYKNYCTYTDKKNPLKIRNIQYVSVSYIPAGDGKSLTFFTVH